MKSIRIIALLLVLVMAFSLAACGGDNTDKDKDTQKDQTETTTPPSDSDGEKTDGATAKLESHGVFLSYPTDSFTYEDRISDKIVANDGSVYISMYAWDGENEYQSQLDKYSASDPESFKDLKSEETTVAGYKATLFTYCYYGQWEAHWVIDLGENASGQTCLVVGAYSDVDLASCTGDVVKSILETISFS